MRYLIVSIFMLTAHNAVAHNRIKTVYQDRYITNTVYVTQYVDRVVTQKVETLIYTNAPSQPTVIGDYDGVMYDKLDGKLIRIWFKEER